MVRPDQQRAMAEIKELTQEFTAAAGTQGALARETLVREGRLHVTANEYVRNRTLTPRQVERTVGNVANKSVAPIPQH